MAVIAAVGHPSWGPYFYFSILMRKYNIALVSALCCAAIGYAATVNIFRNSKATIKKMTLEEKASIVMGSGKAGAQGGDAVVGATTGGMLPGTAATSWPIERLGIPAIAFSDGPAGLRIDATRPGDPNTYYCTHFPISTLLACTWNTDLVTYVGEAIGNEAREYGSDILNAPAVNIMRNPLCGRNFEYFSEEPVLAGNIAATFINGVQSQGIGADLKHFAVNNQETNRQNVDSRLSTRALREIYLKPFEIAVKKSHPWMVMSSYNYINGQYASQSSDLLTTILREEWGFDGTVVTDWFAGQDVTAQMAAGNDLLMPGRSAQHDSLVTTMRDGRMDMKAVDHNIYRILNVIKKTQHYKGYKFSNNPDLKGHAEVTRRSATEGMVLLKNDNSTLPLSADIKNVALYGCTSYRFIAGGTGSGNVNRAYTVSLLQGLEKTGYQADIALSKKYEDYIPQALAKLPAPTGKFANFLAKPLPQELTFSSDDITAQAKANDIAIITLGRQSGEFLDRSLSDFNLSSAEYRLLSQVCRAFHAKGKKVVVLLNIGGVIETDSWKHLPDAILCAWQGGQEGGNSVADILSGKVSPSGKLSMTFPLNYEDVPSALNFPSEGLKTIFSINNSGKKNATEKNIDYTNYDEDIYVGYRYYDSFDKAVSYPFGYGLSYTTFAYSNPKISLMKNVYTISIDITNTGKRSGKEVVQLYVSAPNAKSHNKPMKELKAFAKTRLLQPGESQTLSLQVNASDLASFDSEASAWKVDAGTYNFHIAASSKDIKYTLTAKAKAWQQNVNRVLEPQYPLHLIHR